MNASIFWRLVWKEYRVQRAFWMAIVLLTAFLQFLVWIVDVDPSQRDFGILQLALALPAFYALGCGATLFATEHENGTYAFQRALPVGPLPLFWGKIAFAPASTLAMIGLLIAAGLFWVRTGVVGVRQAPVDHGQIWPFVWGLWGLAAVELFVWGTFFSLLLQRPLVAAVLGVTAASFGAYVVAAATVDHFTTQMYLNAIPARVAIAVAVSAADVWLGLRWFREGGAMPAATARRTVPAKMAGARVDESAGAPTERISVLGRLIWQHWRQSAWTMGAIGVLVVPLLLSLLWLWLHNQFAFVRQLGRFDTFSIELGSVLALVAAPLMGASVFHADQRGQSFRFLTDHGVRPTSVWLSRQLLWVVPLLIAALVALIVFILVVPADEYMGGRSQNAILRYFAEIARNTAMVFGYVVLALSAGQFCSMLFRSGLLAGIFSLLLTGLLAAWAALMSIYGISWLWSVVPIPLVLLLATWVRTPGWLLERNTRRAWVWPAAVVLVPAAALLTTVQLYRIYEIPAVDPGFSPEEYARPRTPQEQATLDLYEQAWGEYASWQTFHPTRRSPPVEEPVYDGDGPPPPKPIAPPPPLTREQVDWIKANELAIALTLKASQRKDCDFFDPYGQSKALDQVRSLGGLLVDSARQLESEGKLDAALDRYMAAIRVSVHLRDRPVSYSWDADSLEQEVYRYLPYWAIRPGQTPERIHAAIRQLEQLEQGLPSRADEIKCEYLRVRGCLSGQPEDIAGLDVRSPKLSQDVFKTMLWLRCLPWERARAMRLLNTLAATNLERLQEAEAKIARGERIDRPPDEYYDDFAFALRREINLPAVHYSLRPWNVWSVTEMETSRRVVRVILALEAWKLQHGNLPDTLDALVGTYFARVPIDPYAGRPLRYFPKGLPIPATCHTQFSGNVLIPAGTPFVWSTGWNVRDSGADVSIQRRYDIYKGSNEYRSPTSEYDLWQHGRIFPLPQ